jgi:hypothetical protein
MNVFQVTRINTEQVTKNRDAMVVLLVDQSNMKSIEDVVKDYALSGGAVLLIFVLSRSFTLQFRDHLQQVFNDDPLSTRSGSGRFGFIASHLKCLICYQIATASIAVCDHEGIWIW